MTQSSTRIRTTHSGSLPRGENLLDALQALHRGEPVETDRFRSLVLDGLVDVVGKQLDAGVDIISDGELPRIGFQLYAKDRMSGFGGVAKRGTFSDFAKFPKYAALRQRAHAVDHRSSTRVQGDRRM